MLLAALNAETVHRSFGNMPTLGHAEDCDYRGTVVRCLESDYSSVCSSYIFRGFVSPPLGPTSHRIAVPKTHIHAMLPHENEIKQTFVELERTPVPAAGWRRL